MRSRISSCDRNKAADLAEKGGPLLPPGSSNSDLDAEDEVTLVCELPTAIMDKAERHAQYTSLLRFSSSALPISKSSPQVVNHLLFEALSLANPAASIWKMADASC